MDDKTGFEDADHETLLFAVKIAQKEIAKLKAELAAARDVLKELEWQKDTMPMSGVCPLCEGMPTPEGETPEPGDGHAPGCKLAAVLGR